METYRLFAAVRPPNTIIKELTQFQKGVAGAKWSDAIKLHITLGFFGDVSGDDAETLDEKLAQIQFPSFEISLSGAGHFGRNEPHAIWVGVEEQPEIFQLHKKIKSAARQAGIEMEKRDYRPHVTLAYLKAFPDVVSIAKWEQRLSGYRSKSFLVDEFLLYSSWRRQTGSNLYKVEASYPLLGHAGVKD